MAPSEGDYEGAEEEEEDKYFPVPFTHDRVLV